MTHISPLPSVYFVPLIGYPGKGGVLIIAGLQLPGVIVAVQSFSISSYHPGVIVSPGQAKLGLT